MTDKNQTYTKEFHCNNCNRDFGKVFQYGEIANKGKCPFCGVSQEDLLRPRYAVPEERY